jgi:hypothetical protein
MMHSASEVLAATSASELGAVPNRKEETKKKKKGTSPATAFFSSDFRVIWVDLSSLSETLQCSGHTGLVVSQTFQADFLMHRDHPAGSWELPLP